MRAGIDGQDDLELRVAVELGRLAARLVAELDQREDEHALDDDEDRRPRSGT